jgi:hypothetical protein
MSVVETPFTREQLATMRRAFDRSWSVIAPRYPSGTPSAERVREMLAAQILELAREGRNDEALLAADALRRLPAVLMR